MARAPNKAARAHPVLRALYRAVVALSALIVLVFCGFKLMVPVPEQKTPPVIAPTHDPGAQADPDEPDEGGPTPLVRKTQFYTFLLAATDQDGGNTDTIMVVSFDVPNQRVGLVSIPRDTLIDRSSPKINSVYSREGVEGLRDAVADLMGFPIDYYITVDMKAFKALVNAVDGIDFNVPVNMNYDDPTQNLSIHYSKGMQHLNGQQALEVARFRQNNNGTGYGDSDIGRTRTQQQLLTAIAKKVVSWSGLTKFDQFLSIFEEHVTTDLSGTDIAWFASKAVGVDFAEGISTTTLPGDGSFTHRGSKWCYRLYEDECLTIINEMLNPYTAEITAEMANIFQP